MKSVGGGRHFAGTWLLFAQVEPGAVRPMLAKELQSSEVAAQPLLDYLMNEGCRPLSVPAKSELWTPKRGRLRQQVLDNVIFHGLASRLARRVRRNSGDLGCGSTTAPGYRMRKLALRSGAGFLIRWPSSTSPPKADAKSARHRERERARRCAGQSRRVQAESAASIRRCTASTRSISNGSAQGELGRSAKTSHTSAAHMDLTGTTGWACTTGHAQGPGTTWPRILRWTPRGWE